jgi:hypothetical protein
MPPICLAAAVLVALCLGPSSARAQQAPATPPGKAAPSLVHFAAVRTSTPVKVDGVLDDEAWKAATAVPVLYEWAPGDNATPPVRTECLVTYDRDNLYVAFRAFDPDPRQIRAHLMDRDDTDTLIQDDHIGVMIDTFNDERRAFQFRVNPKGVQADALFSEQDGVEDFSWDMIWDARGRITPEGYIVEAALPLKQLRFPGGGNAQTWGFEAFRSWPRNVRHRLTSRYTDRDKGCILCQENKIDGFEGLEPGRNIELDPTATFSRTDQREASGGDGLAAGDIDSAAGISGRWSVTPNWTFNGTVNPDFSQIEADIAQLDVNTRFALYYPEKRPFFLESIDVFTTPIQAVFTRTVADPYFGAKVTGKQGRHLAGVFVTRDRLNNLLFPSNEGSDSASADDDVTGIVGRYRADVGAGSTVGVLYSGREGRDYFNRQVGADAFIRVTQSDSFRLQYLHSETQYPATLVSEHAQKAGGFGGDAATVQYNHFARHWIGMVSFDAYTPEFRSDSGFVPQVDLRMLNSQVQRRFRRAGKSWFNMLDLGVRGWRGTTWDGDLREQTGAAFVNYMGPFQTQGFINVPRDVVVYGGTRYEYWRPNVFFGIKPTGGTNLEFFGRFGGGVDYSNSRAATSAVQLNPAFEYRPASSLSLRVSYNLDQLSVDGGRLYRAHLVQGKALYHLNVRTFVRAILQYTDITRTPDLYSFPADARTRRLFSQFLFSLKINPQTVFFAGYSDNSSGAAERRDSVDLVRVNRTFFVKIGYAWAL